MSATEQNRKAYAAARLYLEMRGYRTLELNFRRPRAEVDIITKKDTTIFFVDVIYHRFDTDLAADASAISSDRLRQLKRGALSWTEETKWTGKYQFSSVEIAGDSFTVMGFIDSLL
jgi:Holliday junction resolvase-like predicted endonuclease